ncbi:MAG: 4Fe-4S binding protein [Ruminococcaceae bacterium]|nr:4Fe-4S binding protein [Oscillospiraceae bacterium]
MAKKKKRGKIRLFIQCAFAALSNGHLIGFRTGRIYTGELKSLCSPGLNCYSCPGALGSCPIGSLQSALGTGSFHAALYVLGILTVLGTVFGRLICGFLCPFGLIQDLLHKIPFPKKVKKLPLEKHLRRLRYLLLALFVLVLPTLLHNAAGGGDPWFCKYICPAGTLEAGIPLVLLNPFLQNALGDLYVWKLSVLAVILVASVLIYRPFCRYLCPLGALYGLFNRFALYRYRIDEMKCISCGACQKACKLGISVRENPNSADCIRCGECLSACAKGAIQVEKFKKKESLRAKEK